METADGELQTLRRRAYGPDADIQSDPHALERLRQLESAGRPIRPPVVEEAPPAAPVVERATAVAEPAAVDDEDDPGRRAREAWRRVLLVARAGLSRLARVRRSTVLIVLSLAVIAFLGVVALVLVQRVQSDPLQAGAEQIARLSIDPDYEVPRFFGGPAQGDIQGFQDFHGLQVVLNTGQYFGSGADDHCLVVYSSTDMAAQSESDSFSGMFRSGCGAGVFPAMTQFRTDSQDLSEEVRSALPGWTALQFVYDSTNHEVVVFGSGDRSTVS